MNQRESLPIVARFVGFAFSSSETSFLSPLVISESVFLLLLLLLFISGCIGWRSPSLLVEQEVDAMVIEQPPTGKSSKSSILLIFPLIFFFFFREPPSTAVSLPNILRPLSPWIQ